jgi:hypothetical protein
VLFVTTQATLKLLVHRLQALQRLVTSIGMAPLHELPSRVERILVAMTYASSEVLWWFLHWGEVGGCSIA